MRTTFTTEPPMVMAGAPRHAVQVALALLAVAAVAASAAAGEAGVPYLINFDPKQANPSIGYQSWAALEDPRGVMYFGNTSGVVEFDGVSWQLIPLPGGSTVRSLAIDDRGHIFVGGQGTFGMLQADPTGQLRYQGLSDAFAEDGRTFADVWKTFATADGVYFQCFDMIFRWSDGKLTTIRPERAFHMSFQVRGQLWVREEGVGLERVVGDHTELLPGGETFANTRVYAVLELADGSIVVGTRESGLYRMEDERFVAFPTEADQVLADAQLYHGVVLGDGSVALATLRGGVVVIDHEGALQLILDNTLGLQDSSVTSVSTDRRGGLWLTFERNASRVQIPASFTVFGELTGLSGAVSSVLRFHDTLYVTTTRGVYRLSPPARAVTPPATVSSFVAVPGVATQSWDLLAFDSQLLAATNDGVFRIGPQGATQIAPLQALVLERSATDPSRLFVGTLDGVHSLVYRDGAWEHEGTIAASGDEVRSLAIDARGGLWIGGRYDGIHLLEGIANDNGWRETAFGETHGLPPGHRRMQVFRVGERLVVATASGLFAYDAEHRAFQPVDDLGAPFGDPTRWVTVVREGPRGELWLVSGPDTGIGLSRLQANGVREWDSSRFRGIAASSVLELYPEDDGTLWLGTANGLIRHDPNVPQPVAQRLQCLIRRVTTLDDERPVFRGTRTPGHSSAKPLLLPHGRNGLRFDYAAPLPGAQTSVEYRSRLEGFDRGWSEWSHDVRREYTNLPAGRYRFLVMARAPGGVTSQPEAYELQILPPWYRTWWAATLFMAGAVALLWAFVELEVRHARRKERAESDNRRRSYELQRARSIQHNMLPGSPPVVPGLDIAAEQRTATEVGGDYYDFFPQPGGSLFIAVGDATGHGLGAGLMVAATRTALLTVREPDLVRAAHTLNHVLRRVHLGNRLNMALTLASLAAPGDGSVEVAASGGGMPPMYVLRSSGEVEEHLVSGVPLGALQDPEYSMRRLSLRSGDALILMSDGILECRRPSDGRQLGYDGVHRFLVELAPGWRETTAGRAADLLDALLAIPGRWAAGCDSLDDDVTVVVVRITDAALAAAHLGGSRPS